MATALRADRLARIALIEAIPHSIRHHLENIGKAVEYVDRGGFKGLRP
jgi:hypothetical protein